MRFPPHISRVAWLPRIALATLYLSVHGCAGANGGAVELSWKLRPASGATVDPNIPSFLDCGITDRNGLALAGTMPVAYIELDWTVGTNAGHSVFKCRNGHGVTGFDLPPGVATLSVRPLCGVNAPADPAAYEAPAPEQRSVGIGDTISLGGVELVVEVSDCGNQPCICQ